MNKKKLWLIPAISIPVILIIALLVVLFFQYIRIAQEAPTIELEIYDGPDYIESENMCYYRVEAVASGKPDPEITFSDDDNVRLLGTHRLEVAVEAGKSYDLTATASNSSGTATFTINLSGECGQEAAGQEIAEEEIAVEETTGMSAEEPEPEPELATETEPEPEPEPELEPEPEPEPEPAVAVEEPWTDLCR